VDSVEHIDWPEDTIGLNEQKLCYKLPDGKIVGKVMVFVNPTWNDPDPKQPPKNLLILRKG